MGDSPGQWPAQAAGTCMRSILRPVLDFRAMEPEEPQRKIIKTSDPDWLKALATIYKAREAGLVVDDAGLGIDPAEQTLLEMAKHSGLSKREIAGACVAMGMSAAGVAMIVMAVLDPEPTSKLGLLVSGGLVCVLGGGFSAIRILTTHKPPAIRATMHGIEISWN